MKYLVLAFALISYVNQSSFACSVSVNDLFQKNLLTAFGASHLDIPLTKVTSTTLTGYAKTFLGQDPATHCPLHLQTEALIKFKYRPTRFQNCDGTVRVRRTYFLGEVPTGPIEEMEYSEEAQACSTFCIPGINC